MENVLLVVELILALFIIVVVLLQRSEGGALGIGGGGGGGVVSGRGAATALTKVTWALAAAFFAVALALTVLAAERSATRSVINGEAGVEAPAGDLTPPSADGADLPSDLQDLIAPPPGANPLIPPAAE
ncbi:preprotein translocase subunit SecG [Rhodovulum sp. DZ06]|uniref:preprotein translocase subunit SecG n=1 Tax=Rhodovulum sp. DZ06 TaxID=3425126 RepID=UPI003D3260AE